MRHVGMRLAMTATLAAGALALSGCELPGPFDALAVSCSGDVMTITGSRLDTAPQGMSMELRRDWVNPVTKLALTDAFSVAFTDMTPGAHDIDIVTRDATGMLVSQVSSTQYCGDFADIGMPSCNEGHAYVSGRFHYDVAPGGGAALVVRVDGVPAGMSSPTFLKDVWHATLTDSYSGMHLVEVSLVNGASELATGAVWSSLACPDGDGDGVGDSGDSCASTVRGTPVDVTGCQTTAHVLMKSGKANRSNATPLELTTAGYGEPMYVFVGPAGSTGDIASVSFKLDGASFSIDKKMPFDFAGSRSSSKTALAYGFDPDLLRSGYHVITATAMLRNGNVETLTGHFSVSTPEYRHLSFSTQADRSSPHPLNARTLQGKVAVFVSTPRDALSDISSVTFFVDGERKRADVSVPYDLVGGTSKLATLLDTTKLANGSHAMVATITLRNGTVRQLTAGFTVAN